MKFNESQWKHFKSYEIQWNPVKSYELLWNPMTFYEIQWNPMTSYEILWNYLNESNEILWNLITSYEFFWNQFYFSSFAALFELYLVVGDNHNDIIAQTTQPILNNKLCVGIIVEHIFGKLFEKNIHFWMNNFLKHLWGLFVSNFVCQNQSNFGTGEPWTTGRLGDRLEKIK